MINKSRTKVCDKKKPLRIDIYTLLPSILNKKNRPQALQRHVSLSLWVIPEEQQISTN